MEHAWSVWGGPSTELCLGLGFLGVAFEKVQQGMLSTAAVTTVSV